MEFVRKYFPQLHVHASTQMTILGELTVKELKNKGVTRIVTPRELQFLEIKKIKENCDIETRVLYMVLYVIVIQASAF